MDFGLFAIAHTVVAAITGAAGFYLANRLKLKAVEADIVAIAHDFDHTPTLAEIGKDVNDVKQLVTDILSLRADAPAIK